ncbi:Glutathione S-transferase, N-terminal domain protein [Synechococcus sp. PCC 7335]|uniref:glutathione S-transferase family protein n=1 Tax=Synechococcus sp. (strain ATCC 29403 / PCC 7335) TaxID=91464 RepID=UPI00017EE070|nr:glutathione S-transferase family protein [Synechococcus sp. PCC 7335]EDX87244.1 Glutathione S-transferase, N-terminal domain protein [Synechococcus sp. PCC 7335]
MQLVGMLDSPYVRRVAIALHSLHIPFDHLPLSVFRNMPEFSQINPLIKAPTLVCDDGEVLMDSSLILDYIERLAGPDNTLMPVSIKPYQRTIRLIGLGINACDKTVQVEYERKRPEEKQYQPWRDRIQTQLIVAYDQIETYATKAPGWLVTEKMTQADITVCVAWQFTRFIADDVIDSSRYPGLASLSKRAEASAAFKAVPIDTSWEPKF